MKAGSKHGRCQARTPEGKAEFDLGIAVLAATRPKGYRYPRHEIAAYTGMTMQGIFELEKRAVNKLRKKFRTNPQLMTLAREAGMQGVI